MKNNLLLWGGIGIVILIVLAFVFTRSRLVSLPAPETVSTETGSCRDFSEGTLEVDGKDQVIHLSVAQTKDERTLGLSGCEALPENSGMYFVYEPAQDANFWMKGMKTPIDIVWITDGKVVGVEKQVPVPTSTTEKPPIYQSPGKISAVLEVGSGKAEEYGLMPGTSVTYNSR